MIFAHNLACAAIPCFTPILGEDNLLETVQLPDAFETFNDKLPGTGLVGVHLAMVFV